MKMERIDREYNGPVQMRKNLIFSASKQEVEELRKALEVITKWKRQAFIAVKHKERDADWTMVDFSFKGKDVAVDVQSGACG
jgi:hypothetical protein